MDCLSFSSSRRNNSISGGFSSSKAVEEEPLLEVEVVVVLTVSVLVVVFGEDEVADEVEEEDVFEGSEPFSPTKGVDVGPSLGSTDMSMFLINIL